MEIRPILSALTRNSAGAVLVSVQIAITLAIVVNAVFLVTKRIETVDRPTGIDEYNMFAFWTNGFGKDFNFHASVRDDMNLLRHMPGVIAATPTPQVMLSGISSRAAETLVAAGLRPTVVDENARWGGQIYRQPPANGGFQRSKKALYGFEANKADALHTTMAALLPHLDYRPDTLAWACEARRLDTLHAGREIRVPFSHLIIASGATDRVGRPQLGLCRHSHM